MAKRLFLMLFSAILGITFVPETLAQADAFSVTAVDFQEVETCANGLKSGDGSACAGSVEAGEGSTGTPAVGTGVSTSANAGSTEASTNTGSTGTSTSSANASTGVAAQAIPAQVSTAQAPAPVNYTVTKFVNSKDEYVALASNLSYSDIYRYQKLIYGHNSARLLGNLSARYIGETFTITEAGETKTYRVADIQLYEKTADGRLNGTPRLMNKIARTALGHDVAMMTCAGTPDGKGGASHRLVVFADAM